MSSLPPVVWTPSPNFWRGPSGYATRGIVNHRIVGTLEGATARFMNPAEDASSHFGIGYGDGGRLVIRQFVALDDDAWANGDVNQPTWSRLIQGVNPNHYTISIEHEDGGRSNDGVVEDPIWDASVALQCLLASGDPAAVRDAGIWFRDESVVRDLAFIPKDATGFIDHHQIAGPNKPYCFRPWLADPGFVKGSPSRRDQLLVALNASPVEEPVDPLAECEDTVRRLRRRIGTLKTQVDALEVELEQESHISARLRRRIKTIKDLVAEA